MCDYDDESFKSSDVRATPTSQSSVFNDSMDSVRYANESSTQTSQSRDNANINAGSTLSPSSNTESQQRSSDLSGETEYMFGSSYDSTTNSCRRKCRDPWKPPPGMEQQTFERHVQEIVRTLEPVIPPNPFSWPRQSCIRREPDCDRICAELERLAEVLDCPNTTSPCQTTPTAVGSCCWTC